MTFAELKEALKIFQLPERASLQEIKARHRLLVRRYHPDMGDQADPDKIRKINAAYRILMGYCSAYRFCFSQEEFYEQNPEERMRSQFFDAPGWTSKER